MNNPQDFWQRLLQAVEADERCVLLCVVESIGSSPGRAGFKMFVTSSGAMHGSIGGGSMEHKLVELARSLMSSSTGSPSDDPARISRSPFLKRQIHQPGIGQDRSGMICSGEQTVAFYHVHPVHQRVLTDIARQETTGGPVDLILHSSGFRLAASGSPSLLRADAPADEAGDPAGELGWRYRIPLSDQARIAIIGGGHVGTALSRTMNQLGFHVVQYDHREGLNTMEANPWAHGKHVVDFDRIAEHVPDDPALFIALVSYGYRTDEVCLRALIRRRYRYLGMLGSTEKVGTLFSTMRQDGYTKEELARVHAPIGLPIHSRTPGEIAVSIAAEIIRLKNGISGVPGDHPEDRSTLR